MRSKIILLATVCATAVPAVSLAEIPNPFTSVAHMEKGGEVYVGLAGGWNGLSDIDPTRTTVNGIEVERAELNASDGWAGLGTVGYRTPSGLRGELEFGYRSNQVESVNSRENDNINTSLEGDVNAWTIMANVLYDFKTKTPLTPYIGIGAGAIDIKFDNVKPNGTEIVGIDDDVWAPAVQGIVGVGYKVRQNLNLFVNYQYLTALSNPKVTNAAGTKTEVNYDTQTVLAGVSFAFNKPQPAAVEPEPAPEPAPAPAPVAEPLVPLSYMMFFDFDKAKITPEGQAVLATAVENAKTNNVVRIDVTGHTDRSGSDAYNMRLSQRRADAVKKELVKLGLNAAEITTIAKGEADPLVATEDGVREAQNRRVEIVYTQGAK